MQWQCAHEPNVMIERATWAFRGDALDGRESPLELRCPHESHCVQAVAARRGSAVASCGPVECGKDVSMTTQKCMNF